MVAVVSVMVVFLIIAVVFLVLLGDRKKHLPRIHTSLRRLLQDFRDICDKHGIEYWADGGTLLGAVRSGGIIPHDDDIDVCITPEGMSALREAVKKSKHLRVQMALSPWGVHKFKNKKESDVWIDLFEVSASTQPSGKTRFQYVKQGHRSTWPKFWYEDDELRPLQKVPFEDGHIMIPKSPIPYLERGYGADWRVPKVYSLHLG
jgi:lipopolysaccharide cholinephosphotransferase